MIIKCKDCGIEYSYGRNICHVCGDNTLFFGAIFGEERIERKWNCASGAECIEVLIEEPELHGSIIEVFPENYDGDVIQNNSNVNIPAVAIAGGIANKTQIFKALAMAMHFTQGAPMARVPLTAAMKSKNIGEKKKIK